MICEADDERDLTPWLEATRDTCAGCGLRCVPGATCGTCGMVRARRGAPT